MATPKSQKSGASLRGISWNGGERAPLLHHTPPPSERTCRTFPYGIRRSEAAFSTSVEPFHDLFEHVATMFKIVEHVERGACRREQHDAAGRRERARAVDSLLERLGEVHRDGRISEGGADLRGVLADEYRVGDVPARRGGERPEVLALALAARDQHDRLGEALEGPQA